MKFLERALKIFLKLLSENELRYFRRSINKTLTEKLGYWAGTLQFWDDLANPGILKTFSSPASPSNEEIKIYREYFLSHRGQKESVLLLGSTHGIREMLTDLEIKNYVVADFSFRMIEKVLSLTKNVYPENEIWIKSGWSEMPLAPSSFDCIIGDLIFLQILPEDQEKICKKIASLLKTNGIFIVRTHIANTSLKTKTVEEIITEAMKSLPLQSIETNFYTLMFRLRDRFRDEKNQVTDPQAIVETLLNYIPKTAEEREILRRLIQTFIKRAERKLEYVIQTREELETMLQKYFVLAGKRSASDYLDANYFPIYCLKLPPELS